MLHWRTSLLVLLLLSISALGSATTPTASSTKESKPLEIASGSALVVDLSDNRVLYSSHPDLQVPIASVTKIMTALVVLSADQPMDEYLAVRIDGVPEMQGVYSRVRLGSEATRRDLLLASLMSSENRAAATLAHHYPGGVRGFVAAMNARAKALGMSHSRFTEPTGLSKGNVSTAEDLVKLVRAMQQYPVVGWFSSAQEESVTFRKPVYTLGFRNTNYLVRQPDWSIQLTKTGFTNAAGRCLVMQTEFAGKPVALVLLDAFGKLTHMGDASRLKKWIETGEVSPVAPAAAAYKRSRLAQRGVR
jgi:D-alanyl-D-alanine endopeptidase (penicillin-binding protein 7)